MNGLTKREWKLAYGVARGSVKAEEFSVTGEAAIGAFTAAWGVVRSRERSASPEAGRWLEAQLLRRRARTNTVIIKNVEV